MEEEHDSGRKGRREKEVVTKVDEKLTIWSIYASSLSNDRDVATHRSSKWSDEKIKFRARFYYIKDLIDAISFSVRKSF